MSTIHMKTGSLILYLSNEKAFHYPIGGGKIREERVKYWKVSISAYNLFAVKESKFGFRLLAGFKLFSLVTGLGLKNDPFDVMFFGHGMLDRSDPDCYGAAVYLVNGDVLFLSGVGRAGNYLLHRLAAAYYGHAGLFDDGL